MSYASDHLPEFDYEIATTRKVLERLPQDKWDWKPHPKSNTIGWNANHIAESVSWAETMLLGSDFDFEPLDGPAHVTPDLRTPGEVLALFDRNAKAARAAIERVRDETLGQPWSLLQGGKVVFTMPRGAATRMWFFSHIIHHRAILSVYLRLNNVPVPGIYGPSGDEG